MTFMDGIKHTMPPNVWLNSKQIWEGMKEQVETNGKTPWASVGSRIYVDIKKGNTDFSMKKNNGKALFMLNKKKKTLLSKIMNIFK